MATIVQTDENLMNANSYVDNDYMAEYAAAKGAEWEGDETNLVAATQAFDLQFASQLASTKLVAGQRLQFPRVSFTDREGNTVEGVDYRVKNAVCELALLRQAGEDIVATPSLETYAAEVTTKLDVLETTRKYTGTPGFQSVPRIVSLLIAPLLRRRVSGRLTLIRG